VHEDVFAYAGLVLAAPILRCTACDEPIEAARLRLNDAKKLALNEQVSALC
jgi:hypothetical protein